MFGLMEVGFRGRASRVPGSLEAAGESAEARIMGIFAGNESEVFTRSAGAVGGPEAARLKAGDAGPVEKVDGVAPGGAGGSGMSIFKPELPVSR